MINFLTAEQVKKRADWDQFGCAWLKYVRIGDEFRFVDIETIRQHRDLVSKEDVVVSAGMVRVWRDHFCFGGYGSQSSGVGWDQTDVELLERELGIQFVEESSDTSSPRASGAPTSRRTASRS